MESPAPPGGSRRPHPSKGRALDDLHDPAPELLWENEVLIDPAHLQVGHFVSRLDRPWIGTPFPLAGLMISEQRHIDWFRQNCGWVIVDLLRSRNRFMPPQGRLSSRTGRGPRPGGWSGYLSDPQSPINALRRANLDEQIVSDSCQSHRLLTERAEQLIDEIAKRGAMNVDDARTGVRAIAGRLERNLAAMVWLTRIKHADHYTAEHCVNVAILAMGLAQALQWTSEQVEVAGLAGMLHDLGKMKLDKAILNKPGRLTAEEYEHVKRHARIGYEMLRGDRDVHPRVAQAVLEHHERPDGQGYPFGRERSSLQPLSALISVVDAYDAITSRRPYSPARSHHEALGILWKERGAQFDGDMVEALIQFLGWITPGTLVRLTSEQYAVVLSASQQHRLWPLVRLLEPNADGGFRAGQRIDLAAHNQKHPDHSVRVAQVLADDALDVDLRALLTAEGDDVEASKAN